MVLVYLGVWCSKVSHTFHKTTESSSTAVKDSCYLYPVLTEGLSQQTVETAWHKCLSNESDAWNWKNDCTCTIIYVPLHAHRQVDTGERRSRTYVFIWFYKAFCTAVLSYKYPPKHTGHFTDILNLRKPAER